MCKEAEGKEAEERGRVRDGRGGNGEEGNVCGLVLKSEYFSLK